MILSRKDFFREGFYSLSTTLLAAGETLRKAQVSLYCASASQQPENGAVEEPTPLQDLSAEALAKADEGSDRDGVDRVARVDNRHCMAKNCGCFSCLERCEAGAISLVLGEGIAIDATLCTGCGDCYQICPLAPQALALVARG